MASIVVVSHDSHLGDVRRGVLEDAGFRVIAVSTLLELETAFNQPIDLVMIGHSLPMSEQRRVFNFVREHGRRSTPVLQLFQDGQHELTIIDEKTQFHDSPVPDDFLAAVHFALRPA